jgi:hypothetical protein
MQLLPTRQGRTCTKATSRGSRSIPSAWCDLRTASGLGASVWHQVRCPDEDVQPHFAELVGLTAGEALGDERHHLGWHVRNGRVVVQVLRHRRASSVWRIGTVFRW